MLISLSGTFPSDKKIAGVHSIPITEDDRETIEEAGLILESKRVPIAAWYWESTDTYTVFVMARVKEYGNIPEGYETTGRVTMNLETARQIITKIEGKGLRLELLEIAQTVFEQQFRN